MKQLFHLSADKFYLNWTCCCGASFHSPPFDEKHENVWETVCLDRNRRGLSAGRLLSLHGHSSFYPESTDKKKLSFNSYCGEQFNAEGLMRLFL